MSPQLSIRRYVESDHDAVWQLHNRALEGTGAHRGSGPWDDDLHHITQIYLSEGDFLVGEHQSRIAAMGAIQRKAAGCAEVRRMRVDPDYQRQGFGQQILRELERRAIALGYVHLTLATTVQQIAAQNFYVKNGFREVGHGRDGTFEIINYEKEILDPQAAYVNRSESAKPRIPSPGS